MNFYSKEELTAETGIRVSLRHRGGRHRAHREECNRIRSEVDLRTTIRQSGHLIFRQYGHSNYYLYQVWMLGRGEGRQLVRSRTEQETVRQRKSSSLAQVQLPSGPAQQ